MNKRMWISTVLVMMTAVLFLTGCNAATDEAVGAGYGNNGASTQTDRSDRGAGNSSRGTENRAAQGGYSSDAALIDAAGTASIDALTQDEINGILFMREEEKLAHDVYQVLYDRWGLNIFTNIASSEAAHMDAVGELLVRFGMDDPITDQTVGVFTNETLQELYDTLTVRGSESLEEALRVGAAVEEIDIQDLQDLRSISTDTEILRVYDNLLNGSENHLRSFMRTLEKQTGEVYSPAYLTEEDYQEILSTSFQGGSGRSGRGADNRGKGQGRG
ncbi:MAG: DUF2202 domain-containing protein [Anaerolineales bacterium]|nr:DUF2202 domain-containing protein [Anaerolineales bacterium]